MSKPEDVTEVRVDSYYDHAEYGRVRVVSKDEDAVLFECQDDVHFVNGLGRVPKGRRQEPEQFCAAVTPADITLSAPTSTLGAETNEPT